MCLTFCLCRSHFATRDYDDDDDMISLEAISLRPTKSRQTGSFVFWVQVRLLFPSLHHLTSMSFTAATSTVAVTTSKSSSHVTRCSDSQRNYCVNGGECFTLEIMPGSTKFLCRYDMDSGVYVTTLQLICLKDTVDGIMLDDIVTDSQSFKLCFALCLHIRCVEQIHAWKVPCFMGYFVSQFE